MTEKEMLKLSIEEFSRIQRYMLLAEKARALCAEYHYGDL